MRKILKLRSETVAILSAAELPLARGGSEAVRTTTSGWPPCLTTANQCPSSVPTCNVYDCTLVTF